MINLLKPYVDKDGPADALSLEQILVFQTPDIGSDNPNVQSGVWTTDQDFIHAFFDRNAMDHIVSDTTLGQLEASSHKANGDAFFGAGNSTAHYLHLLDYTSNIEFGLEDHYRTGDYVNPHKGIVHTADGYALDWVATMDKGIQNGLHNEQGTNTARSAASFDISMNFGSHGPQDGEFVLTINGHDYTLAHSGSGAATQWFFADAAHNPVQGLTLSPDGHVLQDSANLAFFSNILLHNANPADLKAQDVHIALTEMATMGANIGVIGIAQVTETIHLV